MEDTDQVVIRSKEDIVREVNESPRHASLTRMIGIIALGGFFIDAYDFTSLSAGSVQLQQEFNLSPEVLGIVTAIMAFGAILGAIFGGYFVDRFGRLRMFLINIILFVVATLGAAFSVNYEMLIVFRFLIGVGVGLDVPVAMAFLAEFIAIKGKGRWAEAAAAMWSGATVTGLLVALLLNWLGVGQELWRWAVGLGAVPAVVVLILRFFYMAESPLWEANRGNFDAAAKILTRINGRQYVVAEDAIFPAADEQSPGLIGSFKSLFSKKYRKRSILIAIMSAAQSMQFSSVGFYLPLIAFTYLTNSVEASLWVSVVANSCGLIAALVAASLADRLGLRKLSIVGFAGAGLILLVLGFGGTSVPGVLILTLLVLFIGFHTFGPGSTAQSFSSLSFPTRIRGASAGLSQASNRVGSLIALFLVPVLLATIGLTGTLLCLFIAPAVGLVALVLIKWEPIGKASEIELDTVVAP